MAAPVLDLSTLIDQPCVRIDEATYTLRHPDAMALLQVKRLEKQSMRIGDLLQQDELTAEEEADVARLLNATCREVLEAPDEIHAQLKDLQRIAILDAFMRLRAATMRAQPSGARQGQSQSGARKSRASSASTEAIRKAG